MKAKTKQQEELIMTKFAKKLGSIALATTMLAGVLTGCGKAQNTEEGDKLARIPGKG